MGFLQTYTLNKNLEQKKLSVKIAIESHTQA